jgi:arginyl-tRNA--protein-N-Asp/Glu arginylyltransferase
METMESLFRYLAPPSSCGYLPDRQWSLEYEMVGAMDAGEYKARLVEGWRRFGNMLFRPQCPACRACQSLRVLVDRFRPNRSQRRARRCNLGAVELEIGKPAVSWQKLKLYDRYHAFQSLNKGWPEHPAKDPDSYSDSFIHNPFATEEWCYYLDGKLAGVGYVDALPESMSAIYFYYDPDLRARSLGTWNVLCLLAEAAARHVPFVYLGYFVAGCPSLAYKATFMPNQVRGADGAWRDFMPGTRE